MLQVLSATWTYVSIQVNSLLRRSDSLAQKMSPKNVLTYDVRLSFTLIVYFLMTVIKWSPTTVNRHGILKWTPTLFLTKVHRKCSPAMVTENVHHRWYAGNCRKKNNQCNWSATMISKMFLEDCQHEWFPKKFLGNRTRKLKSKMAGGRLHRALHCGVLELCGEEKAGEMGMYRETTERQIDVLSKELNNGTLAKNNKILMDTVAKYTDAHQEEVVLQILHAGLGFHYPQQRIEETRAYGEKFLFDKSRRDFIERLDAPMAGFVPHARKNGQRQSASGCITGRKASAKMRKAADESAKKTKGQKRNSSDKSAADCKSRKGTETIVAEVEKREAFSTKVDTTTGQRCATVFDEVVRVCFGPLVGLPVHKINNAEVNSNIVTCLRFIYTAEVTMHATITTWSGLATEIIERTVHTHIAPLSEVHWILSEEDGVNGTPDKLFAIFNTKTVQQQQAVIEDRPDADVVVFQFLGKEVASYAEDQNFIYEFIDAMNDRFGAKPEMPSYTVAKSQQVYAQLPFIGVALMKKTTMSSAFRNNAAPAASSTELCPKLTLIEFLTIIRQQVAQIVKPKWVVFALLILDLAVVAQKLKITKTLEDLSIGIVAEKDVLDRIVAAVPLVVCEVLRTYGCGMHE